MSTARFLLGLLLLVVIAGPPALVGWRGQRALSPRPLAVRLLGAATIALGLLLLVGELLGAIGLFSLWPLVLTSVTVSLVAVVALERWQPDRSDTADAQDPGTADDHPRWWGAAAAVAAVGVGVRWAYGSAYRFTLGVDDPDSLQYHLPFAAEFIHTGFTTRYNPSFPDPIQLFYPANSELLQAMGMLSLGHDVLAPLANLGWIALFLAAGWCVGIRDRVAPLTLLVAAVVAALPTLTYTNAGSALTDAPMLALVLVGLALWRNSEDDLGWMAVSGLAFGLAVGVKYTALPTLGVLCVLIVALAPARRRLATFGVVAGGAFAGCGFWLVRNLVRTGSPIPSVSIPFLPRTPLPILDAHGHSVSHYLTDGDIWRSTFWPGTKFFFGWSGILAAAALVLGLVALARTRRAIDRRLLALVVSGAIGGLAYLALPATAYGLEGEPDEILFVANLRYLLPALLAVGIAAVLALASSHRVRDGAIGLLTCAAVIAAIDHPAVFEDDQGRYLAYGVAATAAVAFSIWALHRITTAPEARGRRGLAALLGVGVLVGAVGMAPAADRQLGRVAARYAGMPMYAWVAGALPGSSIGYNEVSNNYVLYGKDWDNRVRYIGVTGPHAAFRAVRSCREYLRVLDRLDLDYVVLGPSTKYSTDQLDLPAWTQTQVGSRLIATQPPYEVYAIAPPFDPDRCPARP